MEYETVRGWISDVQMRTTSSPATERLYLRSMRHYVDFMDMDPDAIIDDCLNGNTEKNRAPLLDGEKDYEDQNALITCAEKFCYNG